MKIILDSALSKKNTDKIKTLSVNLKGDKKMLPEMPVAPSFNAYEYYDSERYGCNKVRLICTLNPVCTNALFNPVTEVVKNEGSKDVEVLNYQNGIYIDGTVVKTTLLWNKNEAIRDTQLSNETCGYKYNCGADIFNNHLLRNTSFKSVNFPTEDDLSVDNFNTIEDFLRGIDGKVVKTTPMTQFDTDKKNLHLYGSLDIYDFDDAIKNNLIEENGWFGFKNSSRFLTHEDVFKGSTQNCESKPLDISKPINSMKAGDFIDMYPDRSLFMFTPKYNNHRNRIEKNWDYCITYPSSSTTSGFDMFLNEELNSLKVVYIDDTTVDDNGVSLITIYSIAQHGLNVGDYVNIYQTYTNNSGKTINNVLCETVSVYNVYNKYIFQIRRGSTPSPSQKITLLSGVTSYTRVNINGQEETLTVDNDNENILVSETGERFFAIEGTDTVNVDPKWQNISFKRVSEDGIDCKYYVRIFSRVPNFKYSDKKPNAEIIENDKEYVKECSKVDFENHINKLAFSKNIYGDPISEIVYTDDIDVSYLKDNLGRPLSDMYLTIVKRNAGYKEWYGKNGSPINIQSENIEFSHCFGENICGLRFSDEANNVGIVNDIRIINSIDNNEINHGLNMAAINDMDTETTQYALDFDNAINFYGDLCCYSPSECSEQVIQSVMNRFNTAQRELNDGDTSYEYFSATTIDNIKSGDYSSSGFTVEHKGMIALPRKEGYYYQPNYKITVKTVSSVLTTQKAKTYDILLLAKETINYKVSDNVFEIGLSDNPNLVLNDEFSMYSINENKSYKCLVINCLSEKKFLINITEDDGKAISTAKTFSDIDNYKACVRDEVTPQYAKLSSDGACNYLWRNVIPNGFDDFSNIESYPFANGAFYIYKNINFYLRRQQPFHDDDIEPSSSELPYYEPNGEYIEELENVNTDVDNYFLESNIKKC